MTLQEDTFKQIYAYITHMSIIFSIYITFQATFIHMYFFLYNRYICCVLTCHSISIKVEVSSLIQIFFITLHPFCISKLWSKAFICLLVCLFFLQVSLFRNVFDCSFPPRLQPGTFIGITHKPFSSPPQSPRPWGRAPLPDFCSKVLGLGSLGCSQGWELLITSMTACFMACFSCRAGWIFSIYFVRKPIFLLRKSLASSAVSST